MLPSHASTVATKALAANQPTAALSGANPLDQVSSADIALTVARMNNLPETNAVSNQAESQAADIAIASTSDSVISKPEVVTTALKTRADIQDYTTAGGDSIASIATKFGVTSSSILWSNGLVGANVPAGTKLLIPPVNGIVYTVKTGDTADSLAAQFHADKAQIVAFNDAEINGLQPGEQIIIPGGVQTSAAPSTKAGIAGASGTGGASFAWGTAPMYGVNGYDFGYCTWYVATQINVPGNWGNAATWAYYARSSGWNVTKTPSVGSIAQTALVAGGEGHVAVVDGVSSDGSMIHIQDMNDTGDGGGFDKVGSGWVAASTFQNFIAH